MSDLKMRDIWNSLPQSFGSIESFTMSGKTFSGDYLGLIFTNTEPADATIQAINSYDSNQELIATLKKEVELAKGRANKARKEEQNKWMPICNKLQADNELLREALSEMVKGYCELVDSANTGFWDPEIDDEVIKSRAALAATAKG